VQLQARKRFVLAVLEVCAALTFERRRGPPFGAIVDSLVYPEPHRRRLGVVTVGRLAVGIVVRDPGQQAAVGLHVNDQLSSVAEGGQAPPVRRERAAAGSYTHLTLPTIYTV